MRMFVGAGAGREALSAACREAGRVRVRTASARSETRNAANGRMRIPGLSDEIFPSEDAV